MWLGFRQFSLSLRQLSLSYTHFLLGFDGWFLPPLSLAEQLGRGVGSELVLVGGVLAEDGK